MQSSNVVLLMVGLAAFVTHFLVGRVAEGIAGFFARRLPAPAQSVAARAEEPRPRPTFARTSGWPHPTMVPPPPVSCPTQSFPPCCG